MILENVSKRLADIFCEIMVALLQRYMQQMAFKGLRFTCFFFVRWCDAESVQLARSHSETACRIFT